MDRTLALALAAAFLSLLLTTPGQAGMDEALTAHKYGRYDIALGELRPLARQGHKLAQYKLGQLYDNGQGVPQDSGAALAWYRKAAEQGHAEALFTVGHMYKNGRAVQRDYRAAMRWFRRAAELGHAASQAQLGVMYYVGLQIRRDYVQAHMWLNIAASLGDHLAPRYRNIVAKRMTPVQIVRADRRALAWMAAFARKQTSLATAAAK